MVNPKATILKLLVPAALVILILTHFLITVAVGEDPIKIIFNQQYQIVMLAIMLGGTVLGTVLALMATIKRLDAEKTVVD